MTVAADAPPLRRPTRLAYGFGSVADGIKSAAFSTYLLLYFNQVLGVKASVVSTAIALTLLVDAVVDPLIGRMSDLTRSKYGRRHPYIFAAAVPAAFFFGMTWFPPAGLSDFAMGVWIFGFAAFARASMSMYQVPANALGSELTQDYAERSRIYGLRYWFAYAGTFAFAAFALKFFFVATPEYPKGQLNPAGYVPFAITAASLIFISILVCGWGTRSRIPYIRQADEREASPGLLSHFKEMGVAFKNRGFLTVFGFAILKWTAIGLYGATSLYFGTYVYQLSSGQLALLTLDSFVAVCIALPLAPKVTKWFGKRNTSLWMALIGITLGTSPLWLTYFDLFFPPGHPLLLPTLLLIGAVYGTMVALSLMMTAAMLADVVEDDAVTSGKHNAGIYFAASSFATQCASGLGILAAGFVLETSQFPGGVDPALVTEAMTDSLIAHYVPMVMGLWAIGCLIIWFYPIDEAKHLANVERLRAREAEAKARDMQDAPLGAPAR
ncbi:Inner membrane symporter YicJ [Tsuneonella dongtanensis]|uniref:Inner membrane symporter YicJ n=1 Tax=Tsuneonella dongtanensis TaxID=692370 RepID=A0A1B2AFR9_9SPHN|nr:MFS transporter [Tsuneonella dongtanensis]ANY20989.1 Inner membrane symporter YicJ [Tsuneonella dongtanensis]